MSITPNVPPAGDTTVYETAPTPRWIVLVIIVLVLGVAGLLYASYETHAQVQQLQGDLTASNSHGDLLSKQLDETNTRLAQVRSEVEVTSQKLGLTQADLARARTLAQQLQQQQEDADSKLGQQIGQLSAAQQDSASKLGQVSTDLTGTKGDLAATKKDLDDTKSRLTSTIGDLGVQTGLIAHNIQEVDALKRLNDRSIFDFNIAKTKEPQHVGPIQVRLTKTDPKHYKFSMTVIADDKAIEKKDRNVEEPLQFYVRGARAPYEMVVFEVTKDHITGYLSAPKDMPGAPGATATPASAPGAAPTAATARQ